MGTGTGAQEVRRACGQLLSVGYEGPTPSAELLERVTRSEVGSVMVFSPNAADVESLADAVGRLRAASPAEAPLVVSIDQEGGVVQRVRAPATVWPAMLAVGETRDAQLTEAIGAALGRELAALGIGWNLAPVLDVHTNPSNPVIGTRAFGVRPDDVIAHALAFWRGLRSAGVAGCGKHFPGHGDTLVDSHLDLPRVPHPLERLQAVELAPFAAAANAGMEAIMTAHVVFAAVDADEPATLSRRVVHDLLRGELGYQGLVVSDDLGMQAVAARYPIAELVVRAVRAGIDHLLIRRPAERQHEAYEALVHAAEAQSEMRARVLDAAGRVAVFKRAVRVDLPLRGEALRAALGGPAHQALVERVVRRGHDHRVASSEAARS